MEIFFKLVIDLLGVPWVHTVTEAILSLCQFLLRNFVTKTMMSCGPFNSTNCDIAKTELKADGTFVWNLLVKTATFEGYFSSWFEPMNRFRCFLYCSMYFLHTHSKYFYTSTYSWQSDESTWKVVLLTTLAIPPRNSRRKVTKGTTLWKNDMNNARIPWQTVESPFMIARIEPLEMSF